MLNCFVARGNTKNHCCKKQNSKANRDCPVLIEFFHQFKITTFDNRCQLVRIGGMILSDSDIKKYIKEEKIKITPKPDFKEALGSNSLDLRLGNKFRVFNHSAVAVIDTKVKSESITTEEKVDSYFILHPSEFVLAVTKEHIELPDNICARLEGRSSLGRLGIVIHSTAGSINAGFKGTLTLELANMGRIPVKLYTGMRICALSFEQLTTPSQTPYYKRKGAKYLNQKGPGESKLSYE